MGLRAYCYPQVALRGSRAQHAPTEERAWAGGWGGNCQVACTARSYRRAGMGWRMGRELPGRVHSTLLQKSGHGLADGAGIARSRAQHAPTEDGHGLADGAGIARSRAQHAPTEERAWAGGWGGNCQVACTARSYRRHRTVCTKTLRTHRQLSLDFTYTVVIQ